jgi:hypothetical protein
MLLDERLHCVHACQVAEKDFLLSSRARRGLLIAERERGRQIPRRLRLLGMTAMGYISKLPRFFS